jgi:redox-sensitive bicupin YhaK (pirin superfamily)
MKLFESIISSVSHAMAPFAINRVMPQQEVTPVGAFVFLDHFDISATPEQLPKPDGKLAHPHRGIATLTYLLKGEITHLDSYGHKGTVDSGGVQWMKAGNGIVHDEWAKPINNKLIGLQFWLNLNAKGKAEIPEYKVVSSEQLPLVNIGKMGSTLRVIIGKYENNSSDIPVESRQSLFHLSLKSGDEIHLPLNESDQYAVFLASGLIEVDGETLNPLQQGFLKNGVKTISIIAKKNSELFIFGGEKYLEPIVSGGPFVMNSEQEVATAYKDYQLGKYRTIDYSAI